ncbi:hypothetical protein ACOMHN_025361 [Nucella lapillus]
MKRRQAASTVKRWTVDKTVDWWSFGIILYRMVVGEYPFSKRRIRGDHVSNYSLEKIYKKETFPTYVSQQTVNLITVEADNGTDRSLAIFVSLEEADNGTDRSLAIFVSLEEADNGTDRSLAVFVSLEEVDNGTDRSLAVFVSLEEVDNGTDRSLAVFVSLEEVDNGTDRSLAVFVSIEEADNGTDRSLAVFVWQTDSGVVCRFFSF